MAIDPVTKAIKDTVKANVNAIKTVIEDRATALYDLGDKRGSREMKTLGADIVREVKALYKDAE